MKIAKFQTKWFFLFLLIIFVAIKFSAGTFGVSPDLLEYEFPVFNVLRIIFYIGVIHLLIIFLIGLLLHLTRNTPFPQKLKERKMIAAGISHITNAGNISFVISYALLSAYFIYSSALSNLLMAISIVVMLRLSDLIFRKKA